MWPKWKIREIDTKFRLRNLNEILGRHRHKWEYDSKMDVRKEIRWGREVDQIRVD